MTFTDPDSLVDRGGPIKALGNGKVGGYLVLFGSPQKTDISAMKDYFTEDTDFNLDFAPRSPIYYDHGLDPTLKRLILGEVELKKDKVGIWAEGQLRAREGYEAAVKEMLGKTIPELIAGKKLGWSSGTAPHLVERKQVGQAHEITRWPLGLDASLTVTPAEPRTQVVSLKSWVPAFAKGIHLGDRAEIGAAMAAVQHLHGRLHQATWDAMSDEKSSPGDRMQKISDSYDECKSTCMSCMKALLGEKDKATEKPGENGDGAELKAVMEQLEADSLRFDAELFRSR